MSREDSCRETVAAIVGHFGRLDILINNAALVGADKATHETSERDLRGLKP